MSSTVEQPIKQPYYKQKTTIFQKYMIIRLNDTLFRKQMRHAFDTLIEMKPIEQSSITPEQIVQKEEAKCYTVELEIIRPKIRGEVLFNQTFNVSDLKIPKKNSKLQITKPSDSIANFESEKNEMESYKKKQDLKQLMELQKSMKGDKQINQEKAKTPQNQIGIYQILVPVFVLYLIFLTL